MLKKIIIFPILIIFLFIVAYRGLIFLVEKNARTEIGEFIDETPAVTNILYDDFNVQFPGPVISINKITIELSHFNETIHIKKLKILDFDSQNEIPGNLHFKIKGLKLYASQDLLGDIRPILQSMDYHEIEANGECSYNYSGESGELLISKVKLDIEDVGIIELKAHLNNCNLASIKQGLKNPLLLVVLAYGVTIKNGILIFQDKSFVNRLITAGAEKSHLSIENYRHMLIEKIDEIIRGKKKASVKNTLRRFRKFLLNPGHLTVSINPGKAVSIGSLLWIKDPFDLIELLNISVDI